MKSLIILKGLVKSDKKNWVIQQGLDTFFLDYEYHQTLYSTPELIKSSTGKWDYLGRIKTKQAYESFIEAVNSRMENGCLVVIDPGIEKTTIYETMATVYGYEVFYKVFPVPQDFLGNPKKYSNPLYRTKKREDLEEELKKFMNSQFQGKNIIEDYNDIINYWEDKNITLDIPDKEDVFIFSDIHGNYDLLKSILDPLPVLSYKFFLGDYIDGETIPGGSKKMIEYIFSHKGGYNYYIEGNHEKRLRKYLYCLTKKDSESDTLKSILYKSLPEDWLTTVANEFSGLTEKEAKAWLRELNRVLNLYIMIRYQGNEFILTHGGLRCLEQLSPKYIGNVLYGNRDMDEYDKLFSRDVWKKTGIWSIHGHCKYPGTKPEILKYEGVLNLDPHIDRGTGKPEQIIYINLKNKKPCIVQ